MRNFIRWGPTVLAVSLLLMPWQSLQAQRQGRWNVTPRVGLVLWDDASAIQDPVFHSDDCDYPEFNHECSAFSNNLQAGLSALYGLTERISIGLAFDFGRPVTNGAYFPAATMERAGTQELTLVNQRLTVLQYSIEGAWAPSFARLSPFVNAGIGGYTVYLDAPKADFAGVSGFDSFTDLRFSIGVGLDFALGEASGIRLEVRDQIFTGWDRNKLNPVQGEPTLIRNFQTTLFPDLLPKPPDESETLNNFMVSLGFNFVPGGSR